jgi:hypothetical protein
VKAGRYGGTYVHKDKDIAFHFAMWLRPEFQIYLISEFQRLKDDENNRLKLEWNLQRTLAKVNYHIHTVVLSNMESINALLIHQGLSQSERLIQLNKVAITQMKSLLESNTIKKLK